ncbi:MAG TPA: hypothetical protein DCR55_16620 [Lentisphaeria bacterium]|nr:hypothetical protein [Lentisphaeria bacterium]
MRLPPSWRPRFRRRRLRAASEFPGRPHSEFALIELSSDGDLDLRFENSFHLAADSPAIAAGNSEDLPGNLRTDFDGLPRRIGPFDMGVYESANACSRRQ